jgi:hypothetical protein
MGQRGSKRIAAAVAALVALSGALGAAGLAVVDSGSPAGATPAAVVAPAPEAPRRPTPPDLDQLLETADYVSQDGSYVRLGEVEISAASATRATPAG